MISTVAPPRRVLEIDTDSTDPETGQRLIRYKAAPYVPHQQRTPRSQGIMVSGKRERDGDQT